MNIKQYLKNVKDNRHVRIELGWRLLSSIEICFKFLFNSMMQLIPALVFLYMKVYVLGYILLVAGLLKMLYIAFNRNSIKEIYLLIRWNKHGK